MTSTILLSLVLLISACAGSGDSSTTHSADSRPSVSGTVSYREPVTLPRDAVIEVSLLDVSLMDVAAKLISKQTITAEKAVPIPFKLHYDPQDIDQRMTYALQARILDRDDQLLFVTDTSYQVLTRGKPDRVNLVLKQIRR